MFGSTFKTGRATIPSQSQFLTDHYYIVINDLEFNMDPEKLAEERKGAIVVDTGTIKGTEKDILETKLLARNVLRDIANNVPQTEKKNRTKQAIIDFVILNPESRNGDIWKHILANKETKVSLKMFNSYLAELVDEAQIKKTEEDKPGHKYPRYSLILQPERWQYRLFLYDLWLKNISKGIDTLNRQAAKISPEVLTEQMYAINSALEDLLRKQKIMEKFSDHKLLPTGAGNKYIKNLKRLISVQTDALFGILDRVSAKKRKTVLDKMINLSEKDSLKSMSSMLSSGETPFIEFKSHLHPQYFSGQHLCDECKRFFE